MRRILAALAAVLLLVTFASPAASAGTSSTWHRNNFGAGHERLVCTNTFGVWQCRYDSMPNFPEGSRSNGIGEFNGSDEPSDLAWCPDWAPDVCAHAQQYVVGATVYQDVGPGHPGALTLWQELILTDGDGVAPMYQYIVGPAGNPFPVVCPWYPTWQEALDNDFTCFAP